MHAVFKATIEFPTALFTTRKEFHFDSSDEREKFLKAVTLQYDAQVIRRSIEGVSTAEEALELVRVEVQENLREASGNHRR